jgi:hypothetical protein
MLIQMKPLLGICFLLHISAAALSGASAVHNWYFDFYTGETVCQIKGTRVGQNTEIIVIEKAFGHYSDEAFVVESKVEAESGAVVMLGTTRWKQVGDHFEAEITADGATYRGVLYLNPANKAVVEIFAGTYRMNRGEYHVANGILYGRTDIYDDSGKVVTVCNSECKKKGDQKSEPTPTAGTAGAESPLVAAAVVDRL